MCEFHESTCNGFGDIWWTDNPIYFSSIDDELITRLSSSRYGCSLSGKFVGALAYADDITLLCPSLYGLQRNGQYMR